MMRISILLSALTISSVLTFASSSCAASKVAAIDLPGSVFDASVCTSRQNVSYDVKPGCQHFENLDVQVVEHDGSIARIVWNGQTRYVLAQRVSLNCRGTSITLRSYPDHLPPGIKSCQNGSSASAVKEPAPNLVSAKSTLERKPAPRFDPSTVPLDYFDQNKKAGSKSAQLNSSPGTHTGPRFKGTKVGSKELVMCRMGQCHWELVEARDLVDSTSRGELFRVRVARWETAGSKMPRNTSEPTGRKLEYVFCSFTRPSIAYQDSAGNWLSDTLSPATAKSEPSWIWPSYASYFKHCHGTGILDPNRAKAIGYSAGLPPGDQRKILDPLELAKAP